MVNKEGLKQKNRRGKIKRLISPKREGEDLYQRENKKRMAEGTAAVKRGKAIRPRREARLKQLKE
jgi:hypothetical protein